MNQRWDKQLAKLEKNGASQVVLLQLRSNGICRDCRTPIPQHSYAWFWPARETGKRIQCESCYCGKPKPPKELRPAWAPRVTLDTHHTQRLVDENGKEF